MAKILADNADLTRKLAESERQARGFSRRLEKATKNSSGPFAKLSSTIKGMAGPLGSAGAGLAAFGAAGMVLKGAVDSTRELANQTRRLQRETGMSAEQASAFVSIGNRMGVSTSQLSTGFGIFSKQVIKARNGTKGAAGAFEQLGVGMNAVATGDTHTVLLQVAEGFKAMQDGPEKTALAMQLFGRSGKNLIPILNQGRDGIGELEARMKFLGKTIDQDTVDQSVKLGKAQKDLSDTFEGLKIKLGVAVIPKVAEFAAGLSDAITSMSTGKKPTTEMGEKLKRFALEAKKVYDQLNRVVSQVVKFGKEHPALMKLVGALVALKVAARLVSFALPIKSAFRFIGVLGKLGKTKAGQSAVNRISSAFGGLWNRTKGTLGRFGKSLANSLGNAGRSAASRLTSSISSAVSGSMNNGRLSYLKGKFKEYGKGLGKAMGKAAGVAAVAGIYYILKDSPLGRYSGSKGWKNLLNDLKSGFSSLKDWVGRNSVAAFAQGGIVNRRTFAMIGEDGPEAVVPLTKPRRARAVMAQAGLSGGGGNNYFTINTTGSVDEQALAAKIGWTLATRGLA
jgi:hypothetical protein